MMNTVSQSRRSQPMIRPASHNSFAPVSPKRSTINPSSSRSSTGSGQTGDSRSPKTPIYVINNMPTPSKIVSETPQGLLAPYIPAPYELGPNGLQLIMPIRITSHPDINYR